MLADGTREASEPPSLDRGEVVLWEGRPSGPNSTAFYVGGAVLCIMLAQSLFSNGFKIDRHFVSNAAAMAIVVVCAVATARWIDGAIRNGTRFVVTNQQVMISRAWPRGSLKRITLDKLPQMFVQARPDGSGTILFGRRDDRFRTDDENFGGPYPDFPKPSVFNPQPQFFDIDRVFEIENLIKEAPSKRRSAEKPT
ncbi:MAG TPA: hypothetical protein VG248_08010 [Caulobacteraceae bacterium]|jgi:hypothetical protein|nr:hypothetical protein [Caulobacteraceae bacterium]